MDRQTDQTVTIGRVDQTGQTDPARQTGQTERARQTDRADRTGQTGQTGTISDSSRLQRRVFLELVAKGVVGFTLLPLVGCQEGSTSTEPGPGIDEEVTVDRPALLRAYFGEAGIESARTVGGFYTVALGDVEAVAEALRPTSLLINEEPDDARALQVLINRTAADFAEERTFNLMGWTLSVTELSLCALQAATEPP